VHTQKDSMGAVGTSVVVSVRLPHRASEHRALGWDQSQAVPAGPRRDCQRNRVSRSDSGRAFHSYERGSVRITSSLTNGVVDVGS
jgi:hypothetical protein